MRTLTVVTLALLIATPSVTSAKTTRVHRAHGYTATQGHQGSCGEFKYRKNGKCEDARNRSKDWKAF